MQRKISLFILTLMTAFFALVFIGNTQVMVQASTQEGVPTPSAHQLVSSKGLITNFELGDRKCSGMDFGGVEPMAKPEDEGSGFDFVEVMNRFIFNIGAEFINLLLTAIAALDSCNPIAAGEEGGDNLGLFNQPNIFTQFVNVTHLGPLMFLTGIMQRIAMVLMIVFVIYHAYSLLTGKSAVTGDSGSFKAGSSMTFFIKFAIILFVVYAAPFLMQDILNLNNKLSFLLSNQRLMLNNNFGDLAADSTMVTIGNSFVATFGVFLENIVEAERDNLGNIFSFIIALIVLVAILKPLISLVIWWYTRLFKIFVLVVISPVMLMTLASPATERTGKNFINNFVKTAFEQLFVIIGMAVVAVFMAVIPGLTQTLGLGFIGTGLAIYAGFTFVAQIPEMASGMIEGRADGSVSMGNLNRQFSDKRSATRRAFSGAGNAGVAGYKGARSGASQAHNQVFQARQMARFKKPRR